MSICLTPQPDGTTCERETGYSLQDKCPDCLAIENYAAYIRNVKEIHHNDVE